MMRISIWQQFSSNNSSDFTVVGVFETHESAQRAANEVVQMIGAINAWWELHPEADDEYSWVDELPTPPEAEIGKRLGFTWPGAVEWYHSASVKVVLDRLVYITTENYRPDSAGEPFDKVLTALGGQGLLHGNEYGEQIGTILADITCTAPDEATAHEILVKYLDWDRLGRREGNHLRFYAWAFSEFDLPEVITYLGERGCTEIAYRLYQSENPAGKWPTADDVDVLIQILDGGKSWELAQLAEALGEIGDRRAVEPLLRTLKHVDGDDARFARDSVVSALGDLRDPRAVDPLLQLLSEANTLSSKLVLIRSLAKIGDPRAVEPLIKLMTNDNCWQVAEDALLYFGTSSRDALVQAMADSDLRLRERQQHAIRLIDEAHDFGAAFLALRDSDPVKQRQAFEEVKRSPQVVDMLIAILRNAPEAYMRTEAVDALATLGDPRAIQPIAESWRYLGGGAFYALEKFGAAASKTLITLARNSERWVSEAALWSLSRVADAQAAEFFLEVLRDKQSDRGKRQAAGQTLARLQDARATPLLVELFFTLAREWNSTYETWIIDVLKQLKGTDALVTTLIASLEHESNSFAVVRTIHALGQLGDPRAIEPLKALRTTPELRSAVDIALRQLGYHDA